MPTVQEIVWQHGDAYLARHGERMLPSHKRALRAIASCRTPVLGGHRYQCQGCGHVHLVYHACRHRMCPSCQHHAADRWLASQSQNLLAVPYFHLVFTLPDSLRPIVRAHQRVMINTFFFAAKQALVDLCWDQRYLGGQIGLLMVLHTWSRTLIFHPHLHLLVPGVAVSHDGQAIVCKKNFLVPVFALSDRFRRLFLRRTKKSLPDVTLPPGIATQRFVTYSKPVPNGPHKLLAYVARYINKTAISNTRLLEATDDSVAFRYTDLRDHKRKVLQLTPDEFLRRLLCHTPDRGLHRVRHAGFLHPQAKQTLAQLKLAFPHPPSDNASSPPAEDLPADLDPGLSALPHCPLCLTHDWLRLSDLLARPPPTLFAALLMIQSEVP